MIQLTPEQQQFVEAQIATGSYRAPEEVIEEALQLLSKQKFREQETVKTAIRASIPDMDAGRGTPLEEMDAEIWGTFGFANKKT